MAIKKSFKGASIFKPGAYSSTDVAGLGGIANVSVGTLLLVGEADHGHAGSEIGFQAFSSSQIEQLKEYYGSGPLVDCALAAIRPSTTTGVQGAQTILTYKTNVHKEASRGFILISGDNITPSDKTDDNAVLKLTFPGLAASNNNLVVKVRTTDQNGDTTSDDTKFPKDYTNIKVYSNAKSPHALTSLILKKAVSGKFIGHDSTTDIDTAVKFLKALNDEIDVARGVGQRVPFNVELFETVSGTADLKAEENLADGDYTTSSAGSEKYAPAQPDSTTQKNFQDALDKAKSLDYNVLVPCFSSDSKVVDNGGNPVFDIKSALQAVRSHLIAREAIKTRKESQAIVGFKSSAKADAIKVSEDLSYASIQLCIQDVQVLDSSGSSSYKPPHVLAALLAGIRLGTEVGEPLTYKRLNASAIGHNVNPDTGVSSGDFDPIVDFDEAIQGGITFAEPVIGGPRVVIDNTTFAIDDSFVYNRGSVVEASQYVAKRLRAVSDTFVGRKIEDLADVLSTSIESELISLFEERITSPSIGAPQGYNPSSLVVTVDGNAASVDVKVIPVQGLDFVLISLSLDQIRQSSI